MKVAVSEMMELLSKVVERPAMYAGDLRRADGIAVTLTAFILAELTDVSLERSLKEAFSLVARVCNDVTRSPSQGVSLSEETCVPDRMISSDAFMRHGRSLISELEKRNGISGVIDDWAQQQVHKHGGSILKFEAKVAGRLDVPSYDVPQLRHAINVKDGQAFDPMHPDGVPIGEYLNKLREINGYIDFRQMGHLLGIAVE